MSVKRLSVNDIRRITGVSQKQYKKITWHTSEVVVKQFLTFSEYGTLIQNIIADSSAPNGEMVVELVDFAIRVNILSSYAFVDLPENAEDLYYVVYCSDLFESVCKVINQSQLQSIYKSLSIMLGDRGA